MTSRNPAPPSVALNEDEAWRALCWAEASGAPKGEPDTNVHEEDVALIDKLRCVPWLRAPDWWTQGEARAPRVAVVRPTPTQAEVVGTVRSVPNYGGRDVVADRIVRALIAAGWLAVSDSQETHTETKGR